MTPKHLLPRGPMSIGTGDICLGPRAIRMGLEAGSIAAPLESGTALEPMAALEPGTAAGALLKALTREISRASGTTTHAIVLEPGSIGTALESGAALEPVTPLRPGTAAGALLKTLTGEISRPFGTTTHAIALEAVTIRAPLGPAAAIEPPLGHGTIMTPSLASVSVIIGALLRRGGRPGIVGAAISDVGSGWQCVIGRGNHCHTGGTGVTGVTTVATVAAVAAVPASS
jgi:hypothetical protein